MGARKPIFSIVVVCCVVVASFVFVCAPALAATSYGYKKSLEAPLGGFAGAPVGLGVGPGGEVFVANQSKVVDVYEPGMVPEVAAEFKVENATSLYQLAVDDSVTSPSKGDVYIANLGGSVEKYGYESSTRKAKFLESITAGGLIEPTAIAVNDDGDVFVADFHHGEAGLGFVNEYGPHGEVIKEDLITGLTNPEGIAVDSTGDIYVAGEAGVYEYNTKGECLPLGSCAAFGGVTRYTQGVAVGPGGRVFVSPENSEVLVYESDGTLVKGLGVTYATAWGLGFSPLGSALYVTVASGEVAEYEEGPIPEAPETGTAEVKGATAILHGTLNPNASAKAGWYFAYNNNGSCTGGSTTPVEAEVEGKALSESDTVSGLQPLSTYSYCMVAYIKDEIEYGPVKTFTVETLAPTNVTTNPPSGVGIHVATLGGDFNPGGEESTYYFEYGTEPCATAKIQCMKSPEGNQEAGIYTDGVYLTVTGLEPSTIYYYRLVATNGHGSVTAGDEAEITTSAEVKPSLEGESFDDAGSVGVTLTAEVNPGGAPASYYFEYGPTAAYGLRTQPRSVEGESLVSLSSSVEGLTAGTEYHYRVVVQNALGGAVGADASFRTLPGVLSGAPDGRVFEMVTPVENRNANVYVPELFEGKIFEGVHTKFPFQVSEGGDAVAYVGDASSPGVGAGGSGLGNEYLARRSPVGGWVQENIQPPGTEFTEFQGFSNDLSVGVVGSGDAGRPDEPPLVQGAPDDGYHVLYARDNDATGGGDPYRALFSTPLNKGPKEFGADQVVTDGMSGEPGSVAFAGGSAGFGDLLFEANDSLIPGEGVLERELDQDVKQEIAGGEDSNYLYDSTPNGLSLVNIVEGKVVPDATFGAPPPLERGKYGQYNEPDFDGDVSADGKWVFWTDLKTGVVYARVDGDNTVQISAGPARYWTSAENGKYVFYTEGEAGGGEALYRSVDGETVVRERLTPPVAGVLGVIGTSHDGETVYFVAEGSLAAGATSGEPNLYLLQGSGTGWGTPVFVATLSREDGEIASPYGPEALDDVYAGLKIGDWQPGLGQRTAQVTPDGESVVFVSNRSLPVVGFPHGFPNDGFDEVYLFNATSNSLFCVSCSSSGESPPSLGEFGPGNFPLYDAAGFLPISWDDTAQYKWVSDDGDRVFFDSAEPLVAQDTNGKQDVYEWEREGTGGCAEGSGVNGGCVYLLSGGVSVSDSWLIGSSSTGDDVFVITRAHLTSLPVGEAFNLYDARVGGVPAVQSPECTGTGCQGAPESPPVFATPASQTFNGVGNFVNPTETTTPPKAKSKVKAHKKHKKRNKRKKHAHTVHGATNVSRKRVHTVRGGVSR